MASPVAPNSAAAAAASSSSSSGGGVAPAQLGFLAIFNPSLGTTDDTVEDQIVYYASVSTQASPHKRRRTRGRPADAVSQEERHERLRQIGLAQGMASFSRGFANGAALDAIDTETSRVVMHELEPGWWIVASIDLTKVPLPPRLPTKAGQARDDKFECTTREMKPTSLLLRDLLRAHEIFLMHHDSSLSALFVHCRRSKFVAPLSRYWDLFLSTWSVMLHGNPARDIFGGINVAASGELGVGVGEEDRGCGEREVLEGLVGRIEGLVDIVVSKFGGDETQVDAADKAPEKQHEPWLGTGREPAAEDGAIFLGTGALSRKSLRDVTHWMEDLYTWGEHAYGLIESPTSIRRLKARKATKSAERDAAEAAPGSPADVERPARQQPQPKTGDGDDGKDQADEGGAARDKTKDADDGKLEKMLSYMKLGYGSYWTLRTGSGDSSLPTQPRSIQAGAEAVREWSPGEPRESPKAGGAGSVGAAASHEATGHFLIGLRGEIEESREAEEVSQSSSSGEYTAEHNSRTVLRTLHVELESGATGMQPEAMVVKDFEHPASVHTQSQVMGNMLPGYNSHDLNKAHKLRVVVYVNRPFVFVFLFRLRTDSLAWDALYRSLHYQLAPLKKPLLASTSYRPDRPGLERASSSIYSLVWDPPSLTVNSTIPCIPDLAAAEAAADSWSRADAVNTHLHLLNVHAATRSLAGDVERTHKTSRGWWIVWTRLVDRSRHESPRAGSVDEELPASTSSPSLVSGTDGRTAAGADGNEDDDDPRALAKEIFLVRRASDHAGLRGAADGESRLAQGIGVDTRRYVEELLNLL